jgi:hypothetical protein
MHDSCHSASLSESPAIAREPARLPQLLSNSRHLVTNGLGQTAFVRPFLEIEVSASLEVTKRALSTSRVSKTGSGCQDIG